LGRFILEVSALLLSLITCVVRKARTILVGCQERTKRYQKEFEIASHNLYTQEKNQGNLLNDGNINLSFPIHS
jgi:hypothetical protein